MASRTRTTSAPSTRSSSWDSRASALESRQPVYSEDISIDPRVSDFERQEDLSWGHRAMLCLPLISRGEVIGIAGIYDDHARRFERTDFLHSLAQVAAGALANATLFDELDRSAERMALVGDVSFELTSSLDLGRGPALHRETAVRHLRRADVRHLHAARRLATRRA